MVKKLNKLENYLTRWERYHTDQKQIAKESQSYISRAGLGCAVGAILAPLGIGIIILIISIVGYFTTMKRWQNAENNQKKTKGKIRQLHKMILETKNQLAYFQ